MGFGSTGFVGRPTLRSNSHSSLLATVYNCKGTASVFTVNAPENAEHSHNVQVSAHKTQNVGETLLPDASDTALD
jgi:hypothetical protein